MAGKTFSLVTDRNPSFLFPALRFESHFGWSNLSRYYIRQDYQNQNRV